MKHQTALPDWAIARGAVHNSYDALDPGSTAFVCIDMQMAFVAEGEVFGNPYARGIIGKINTLARAFRGAGAPVVWTRGTVGDEPPLAVPDWQYDRQNPEVASAIAALHADAVSHALHPDMDVGEDDVLLDKYRYGAFSCPAGALGKLLAERGITMLVIAGTLTNVCVDTTAREAAMRGYKVIVAGDATAARTDEEHNAALLNLRLNFADVQPTAAILAMLESN